MQFFTEKLTNSKKFPSTAFKLVVITICAVFFINYHPETAHAGLFSFLSGDTASAKAPEAQNVTNSQNMLVLQAVVNNEPNPNKSSNDNLEISGNALIASDITPSGTIVEDDDEITTQISLYVVRDGDTLAKIADMFNVTVNTIIWANDLDRNPVLQKDQKLIILPVSGVKYTVKPGDTVKNIVKKYKSDLEEVLKFNDLTISSVINPGDVIIIPDAEPAVQAVPKILATKKKAVDSNAVHDADGPYYPGYYIRPIDGGRRSQGLHGYNAVDLASSIGTPIHAAAAGTVIRSVMGGWHGGYGNYVVVSHSNGSQTLYAHNQKNYVEVGDRVEQGQIIARVGSTGNSTGPHVHFEIRGAKNPFGDN
jgi:murein DD-endopeptidase MepM/ murein hydrolase activator NlpD